MTRPSALLCLLPLAACTTAVAPHGDFTSDPEALVRVNRTQWVLHVEPGGNAAQQADEWRISDPDGARMMDAVALIPISIWLGDWISDVATEVDDAVTRAGTELQVFTVYNIPKRDCTAFSAGGAADAATYETFIADIATGLDGRPAMVVLEPDALALMHCLDATEEAERKALMAGAVDTLTAAGARVYIDAGDATWIPADDMAVHLEEAGVANAAGFSVNVSHTNYDADEEAFAQDIRLIIGEQARFVVDTSRNGNGPTWDSEWCNPTGRAHGLEPSIGGNGVPGLDARLWIKRPGESDGSCFGGPEAGDWWADYARELAENAGY